jgi:hypothetical protein
MKIEKALQAPINFFRKLIPGCITGTLLPNKHQCITKFAFPQKKAKTQSSGGKRMATIFWAEEGILLIERW